MRLSPYERTREMAVKKAVMIRLVVSLIGGVCSSIGSRIRFATKLMPMPAAMFVSDSISEPRLLWLIALRTPS